LAHALAKPAILVAETMDEIPFDLRALRIIVYDKNAPDWGQLLRKKIEAAIKEVLQSPFEAVLPAFLEVKPGAPAVTAHEKELLEIRQDLDLLRREVRTRELGEREPRILTGPDEARERIRRYLQLGMPEEVIVGRLTLMGVPANWTHDEVRRMRHLVRRPRKRRARGAGGTKH
jgi:hypothetical protein